MFNENCLPCKISNSNAGLKSDTTIGINLTTGGPYKEVELDEGGILHQILHLFLPKAQKSNNMKMKLNLRWSLRYLMPLWINLILNNLRDH